jgi:hypothetical protein
MLINKGAHFAGVYGQDRSLIAHAHRLNWEGVILALLKRGENASQIQMAPQDSLLKWSLRSRHGNLSQYLFNQRDPSNHRDLLDSNSAPHIIAMNGLTFGYDFLFNHPLFTQFYATYGFEKICQLADTPQNSDRALILYAKTQLERMRGSSQDSKTVEKINQLSQAIHQGTAEPIIHALKIKRRWYSYWDPDSYTKMPEPLKNRPQ